MSEMRDDEDFERFGTSPNWQTPLDTLGLDIRKHDKHILDNKGICSALLAIDLHVTERFVISRQRKLGLRPFTGNPPRRAHVSQ
jgi:hypothetical protein